MSENWIEVPVQIITCNPCGKTKASNPKVLSYTRLASVKIKRAFLAHLYFPPFHCDPMWYSNDPLPPKRLHNFWTKLDANFSTYN